MKKDSVFTISTLIGIAFILSLFSIRICPFFYFFHIPCPGCGLTRSFIYLFKGDIIQSLQCNILGIVFVLFAITFFILFILEKTDKFYLFVNKHKYIIYTLSFILMIIVWIININNSLLY